MSGASPKWNFPDKSPRCWQRVFQTQTEPNSIPFLLHNVINGNTVPWLCKKSGGTLCSTFTSPLITFPSQVTPFPRPALGVSSLKPSLKLVLFIYST